MKLSALPAIAGASLLLFSLSIHAAIVETGDLNCIDDPGNASDGLCFLNMSYSDGLSEADALTNAQGTYANARLAMPMEWDDLFAAAGVTYSGALTASDAFSVGPGAGIAGSGSGAGALQDALGPTTAVGTLIWSVPDGDNAPASTRDYLFLGGGDGASIVNHVAVPPNDQIGWLLVTPSPVPAPAAGWLFMSALVGLVGKKRLSR